MLDLAVYDVPTIARAADMMIKVTMEDQARFEKIRTLRGAGRLGDAIAEAEAFCATYPRARQAMQLCAELHFQAGDRDAGFQCAVDSVRLEPSDIRYGLDCIFNLIRDGRRPAALEVASLLSIQAFDDPYLHDALGTAFTFCEEPSKALQHFQFAVEAEPADGVFRYNLASVQRMVGKTHEAEQSLDFAVRLDPADGRFEMARSALRPQTRERNHIEGLRSKLALPVEGSQIHIRYSLAKELEDVGDYEESFSVLAEASRAYRATLTYDLAAELAYIERLRSTDYSGIVINQTGQLGVRPIFVVGLPRSGTTLVDRIITRVSEVATSGETKALSAAIWHHMNRTKISTSSSGDAIEQMLTFSADISRRYRDTLKRWEGSKAVVDKTPSNYLFAGLIGAAFPDAKIICLRRHPMDSCYSLFKTFFADGLQFSYDLCELAAYYVQWNNLVSGWERMLGERWLTLDYEKLVDQPEVTMRRIIEHCDLQWDDRCLSFHESQAPVTSASAGQVNRPIYKGSVEMWRNYVKELEPITKILNDAGITTGA